MDYLYKLVDEKALNDAKNGVIALTRPVFEFKGSEGKIINFVHRIYDKYQKKGLDIRPSETDLADIRSWIEAYKTTYGDNFQDIDIKSESMIMFCGIMQAYCGYFTKKNLCDKEIREDFISKSNFKDEKIAYIRINENAFEHLMWKSTCAEGEYTRFFGDKNDTTGYRGALHLIDIKYSKNYNDYHTLLKNYNGDQFRYISTWFNLISKKYEWQDEKRVLFLLNSLEANCWRAGCDSVYSLDNVKSWEEVVYMRMVDAINYCLKGPKLIKLQFEPSEIEFFPL